MIASGPAFRPTAALRQWQADLAELAFACAATTPDEAGELVLAMRDLLAGAPGEWGRRMAGLPDRKTQSALIAVGGTTSAALALLEGRAGYMLSQAPGGCPMATVVFEGLTAEASAEGDCPATALLGALAACLAGPALQLGQDLSEPAPPLGARLN